MNKKIVGILVCMLLIVTAVPVTGQIKEIFIGESNDFSEDTEAVIISLSNDTWMKLLEALSQMPAFHYS